MKNLKFNFKSIVRSKARWLLTLIAILTLGVGQMWAYNEYNKQYLYFNGSSFTSFFNEGCTPYISPKWDYDCNDGNNNGGDKQMTQIGSSYYYYLDLANSSASYASFRGFYIGRCSAFHNGAGMGYVDGDTKNCIKATGWGAYSWEYYRPPMSSASVVDNGTTKTGSGTEGSPYQVVTGSTIYLSASCVSSVDDPSMTKEYKFWNKGSQLRDYSSTNTHSFTAGAAGTTYEITVTAKNTYQSGSGTASDESTTLYYTIIAAPEPSITALAVSAADVYSGEGSLTLTATRNAAAAGINIQYQVKVPGGSWTNIGDAVNSTTKSYSPTSGHGTYEFRAYPTGYSSNYTDASKDVYEHWNIYVKNNCNWSSMALYQFIDNDTKKSNWPGSKGTNILEAYGVKDWKKVTLDSKWTYFIIDNDQESSNIEQTSTCTTGTSSGTYASGTYWYFVYSTTTDGKKIYTLTKMTLSAPTVTVNIDKTNVNQITVTGTITAYGGYGTTAAEMEAVGFKIGETNYTATYKSGSTFTKTITSLTANTPYTVKAYATSIKATGESSGSSTTTLANSSYTIKVQVPHGDAPYVYAWTDADSYGGSLMTNIDGNADLTTGDAPAMTKIITGSSYDWYSYSLHNRYEKILFYATKNSNNSQNLNTTRAAQCYWYKKSESTKAGTMDCPYETPQVYIETTAGGGSYKYEEMSTSPSISKTLTLAAKSTYKFKIVYNAEYYGKASTNITRASNSASSMAVDGDYINLKTDAAGDYTFTYSSGTVTLTYPTAYTVTFGKGTGGNTISASATSAGGTMTSGDYVASGDDVTFTQTANTGYTFAGWYDASTGGSAVSGMGTNDNILDDIAADATVYSRYTENMTTVALEATNGKIQYWTGSAWADASSSASVGVQTTCSIKAVPNTGYYFAGWTRTAGSDYSITDSFDSESNNNTRLSGNGDGETTGQTLTANFVELEKIYFRNVFDDGSSVSNWSAVYAFLGITWNGSNQAVTNSSNDDWRLTMTQIGGTDVWWAYVPRSFTISTADEKKNVGFTSTKANMDGRGYTFCYCNAATRGDYNKALNMFVPFHTAKTTGNNYVDYYDNGYWMKYDTRADQGAGYYLKLYNKRNDYTQKGEFVATNDDATFIRFSVRIDEGNTLKKFMITSAGGLNYLADAAISSTNCTNVGVTENLTDPSTADIYFELTTTSEGDYTFVLDQSGDKMKLNVIYPVSQGDYRVKHSYSDGGTKYAYSDVIKGDNANPTVSMYYNPSSATMVLQKCTLVNASGAHWNAGTAIPMTRLTAGKGVYQFNLTISSDNATIDEGAGLYDGPFYIKTNSAPGGWANYKQNVMDKNTINATGAGFDYYMCKWIGDMVTNVKCVIANDYNNAVSDTLVSDAILTRGTPAVAYETLPEAANVRFSYDTKTNTLKRTYLKGSTESTNFVTLVPNAAEYVYSAATDGTDYYISKPKFSDNGNWTYAMEAYVYPGAQAGVQTNYPTAAPVTTQTLVPLTNYLMGGTKGSNPRYHVRLVYDYKTDHLMSAWIADGTVSTPMTLNSDFIVIRNGQDPAAQISFSGTGSISQAKRAYGVISFSKSAMVGNMSSWTATAYGLCVYYISFPFDVNVSDIFGVGEMGKDWRLRKYNGAKRAKDGWFAGDGVTTFWEDLTTDSVMHAYEGYCLILNRVNFNNGSNAVWTNIPAAGYTYLYFPSNSVIGSITTSTQTVKVPTHECKIDRYFTQDLNNDGTPKTGARNHKYVDSNWNMMGTPLFEDANATNITTGASIIADSAAIQYIYAWNSSTNTLGVRSAFSTSHEFKSLHAYMVQYAGTVTFSGAGISSVVARSQKETKNYQIEMELSKDDVFAGRAYVELRENACDSFALNEDMYMVRDSKTADLYTYAGGYDLAANVLTITNHIVPVGINIKAAGTYTFSMPSNFDGTVTLVDTYNNTRVNMAIEDYEIYLDKGEINDRFLLEIDINKVTTDINTISGEDGENSTRKFIYDNQLYIMKNGVIYDARGNKVK